MPSPWDKERAALAREHLRDATELFLVLEANIVHELWKSCEEFEVPEEQFNEWIEQHRKQQIAEKKYQIEDE